MPISVGDAVLKITGDIGPLEKSLDGIKGKLGGFTTGLKSVGIGLASVGVAAVGMGVASVKSFSDAGSEIYDMSKRTGMGAKFLSEMKYMADQTGTSIGSVETASKRLSVALVEASQGSEMQAASFARLGLSVEDLMGKSPEEQFNIVAGAIASLEDPTTRAAAAVDVFGRSGTDLLSLLSEGSAGMDAMRQKAQELGVVFTDEAAAQADSLGDALQDVQKSMQGVMNEIAIALAPTIQVLAEEIVKLVKELPLKEIGELITGLLPPLVDLILQIIKAIPMDVLIKLVTTILVPVMEILGAILPLLEPILFIVGKLLEVLTPVMDILGKVLSFVVQILSSGIMAVLSGITSLFGGKATSFKMPSFQGFEGIIPGVPGTPMLAQVHAGEYIGQSKGDVYNQVTINNPTVRSDADITELTRRVSKEMYRLQQVRYG